MCSQFMGAALRTEGQCQLYRYECNWMYACCMHTAKGTQGCRIQDTAQPECCVHASIKLAGIRWNQLPTTSSVIARDRQLASIGCCSDLIGHQPEKSYD